MALPREHLLDELATAYVQVVAAMAGATIAKGRDYGIDGTLRHIVQLPSGSSIETDAVLDFQIKAAVIDSDKDAAIAFDLPVRNYNAIVTRRANRVPFFLFLVCFAVDGDWLELGVDRLAVRASAFWWREDGPASANRQTVRIRVPIRNRLTPHAIEDMLKASMNRVEP
jgi:hypothetical protein